MHFTSPKLQGSNKPRTKPKLDPTLNQTDITYMAFGANMGKR